MKFYCYRCADEVGMITPCTFNCPEITELRVDMVRYCPIRPPKKQGNVYMARWTQAQR
jgi:hypothetical protein